MSSNIINYGVQTIVFDYKQEARGKGFNQAFCDVLPYGLYSGGQLTRISDTTINVGLLVCVIKSDEPDKVALRVETMKTQNIVLPSSFDPAYADTAKPYIVLRFGWHDVEVNYMDMRAVGWSTDPNETDPDKLHPLDIILGKVLFQEAEAGSGQYIIATENPFDLSRRHDVFIKETEAVSGQFRVSPSELAPKKVFISGGKVNTSKGRFLISGSDFPSGGIPDTAEMGRTDLVVVNVSGKFQFIKGVPSASFPAPTPKYQNFKVLAEIRRGPNRSDITGADIIQITDATILGTIAAEDFPLADSENFLPANAKSIEGAFNYIFHHSIAISPQDLATLGVVLRRNVNWGISDPDGVYAGSVPVKDSAGLFVSANVEAVLAEIAGSGRTTETLKGLADAISALAKAVSEDEAVMSAHTNNKSNPHVVTKAQVGLGNVPNVDATNASNLSAGTVPAARLAGALTDAAASTTLPATASETLWAKLQTVRNNLKQLFSYFTSGKVNIADKELTHAKLADYNTGTIANETAAFANSAAYTFPNLIKSLTAKINGLFAGKQNNLNRTLGGNDNATGTVTDTGGALSVPIPVTTVAPAASATQTTAGTRSLRAQLKILIDNIAQLFISVDTNLVVRAHRSFAVTVGFDGRYCDYDVNAYASADLAVQAAIDAITPTVGAVVLQNGTYIFKNAVTINRSDVAIRGQTYGRVAITYDAAYTGDLFRVAGSADARIYHTTFENLWFCGSNAGVERAMIYIRYADRTFIRRCSCRDFRGWFVKAANVYILTATECFAYNIYKDASATTGWAYVADSRYLTFANNSIHWTEAHKLYFERCGDVVINGNDFEGPGVVRFVGVNTDAGRNWRISVTGNLFQSAGLVMPSGIVGAAVVSGNQRWGYPETDLSGAEVVFGNQGFGDDRTENSLVVNGNTTLQNLYMAGSILPKTNPERFHIDISSGGVWQPPRGMYTFSTATKIVGEVTVGYMGQIYYAGTPILSAGGGPASGAPPDSIINVYSNSVRIYYSRY